MTDHDHPTPLNIESTEGASYSTPEQMDQQEKVLTVKEQMPDERPREKALRYGIESLTNSELLALILRAGLPNRPITKITADLMRENENLLTRLERRSRQELMQIPGLGEVKAQQVEAIMELIRRYFNEEIPRKTPLSNSEIIYKMMRHHIGNEDHEEIWALYLDRKHCLLSKRRISMGNSTSSIYDPRPIIKHALFENAESIVMCHNHPSGNLTPSPQDDNITRGLRDACKLMNIRMLDHIIVTVNGYYSYADNGRI